jgi:serine/threonine-protein kinase PRP4|tara:strand:- start:170 stop:1060 length:891 start_codon:yes stop_codon:yes gene_type:complete
MKMSGEKELRVLRQLSSGKRGNETTNHSSNLSKYSKYCITLLTSFSHQHHLAIVTECMHQSLRKLLKMHPSGISMAAVRVYGKQLFCGLSYIHSKGILHADLKLDNIVISADKKRLKICDFGSAMQPHEMGAIRETTELVSRFYRAPEIILGDNPTYGIDVWSGACCLYELCTGALPFTGDHNNGMLRQFMEISGRFPKKVLTRSKYTSTHFNHVYDFVCHTDNTTISSFGTRSLETELLSQKERNAHRLTPNGQNIIAQTNKLTTLLVKLFHLQPEKRLSAMDALRESFFKKNKQ